MFPSTANWCQGLCKNPRIRHGRNKFQPALNVHVKENSSHNFTYLTFFHLMSRHKSKQGEAGASVGVKFLSKVYETVEVSNKEKRLWWYVYVVITMGDFNLCEYVS